MTRKQSKQTPVKATHARDCPVNPWKPGPSPYPWLVTGLILGALSPAWAAEFSEAELFYELNDTDGDLGIHASIDGGPYTALEIEGPDGQTLLMLEAEGAMAGQGLTRLFLESAEPAFIDWDPVTHSHPKIGRPGPVDIVRYQFFVEREGVKFSVDLPPTVTEFEVPGQITALGDEFKFEIIARTATGNNTAIESCFTLIK